MPKNTDRELRKQRKAFRALRWFIQRMQKKYGQLIPNHLNRREWEILKRLEKRCAGYSEYQDMLNNLEEIEEE